MSYSISETQTKQLHLVNIVSVSEDKLQTNFNRILRRLNKNQNSIDRQSQQILQLYTLINTLMSTMERRHEQQSNKNTKIISEVKNSIDIFQELLINANEKTANIENCLEEFHKAQQFLKGFADAEFKTKSMQSQRTRQRLRMLEQQVKNMNTILPQKQNITTTIVIKDEISRMNDFMNKLESEQKFVQFKVDKFQINNQRSDKNNQNKQMMNLREFQDKMKKEIKSIIGSIVSNNTNLMNVPSQIRYVDENVQSQTVEIVKLVSPKQIEKQEKSEKFKLNKKQSISSDILAMQNPLGLQSIQKNFENQALSFSFNEKNDHFDKNMQKINEKIMFHDKRLEIFEKDMKNISEWWSANQKNNKKSNVTELEQKLNAIKPEFVKLWGKYDGLQDKTNILERKVQQNKTQITVINDILKDNQIGKIDEKIKGIQAQVTLSIKDLKNKMQCKVSSTDFEKYIRATSEKLNIINDAIILKCDKAEVKKALLFLESKIKQIILVISEDEQNQKDALLTKKHLKCISCDKEVEKTISTNSGVKGNWDALPFKQSSNQSLGRFGMTGYGTLARKLKKLDNTRQFTGLLHKKNKDSSHSQCKGDRL